MEGNRGPQGTIDPAAPLRTPLPGCTPGKDLLLERLTKYWYTIIPLLLFYPVEWWLYRKTYAYLRATFSQRQPVPDDLWGSDPKSVELARFVTERVSYETRWPASRMHPEDQVAALFFGDDGYESFLWDLEDRLGRSFTSNEQGALWSATLADMVKLMTKDEMEHQ